MTLTAKPAVRAPETRAILHPPGTIDRIFDTPDLARYAREGVRRGAPALFG